MQLLPFYPIEKVHHFFLQNILAYFYFLVNIINIDIKFIKLKGASMKEEVQKILSLLEEGKISKEQAGQLLETLHQSDHEETHEKQNSSGKARRFHVQISGEKERKFEINLPVSWVKFGLRLPGTFVKIGDRSISLDRKLLDDAINNPDFRGTLVDICDEGTYVKVEVE